MLILNYNETIRKVSIKQKKKNTFLTYFFELCFNVNSKFLKREYTRLWQQSTTKLWLKIVDSTAKIFRKKKPIIHKNKGFRFEKENVASANVVLKSPKQISKNRVFHRVDTVKKKTTTRGIYPVRLVAVYHNVIFSLLSHRPRSVWHQNRLVVRKCQ